MAGNTLFYSYGASSFILFVIFPNEIFISQVIINIKKVLLYVNDIIIIT